MGVRHVRKSTRMPCRSYVVLLATVAFVASECPKGCPARCPQPEEFQSDYVKTNFSLSSFWGVYYELAKHDNTQPCYDVLGRHVCVYCVRSVKTINPDHKTYKDLFSMKVFGQADAICDL